MSNSPVSVVTGEARLSYVHLFKPYANQPNQEPKYSTTILIPKSDIATKQRIDAAINAAIQEGVSSKWNGVRPPMVSMPIHDGDGPRPSDGTPFNEECRGHWVLTASSKQAPQVVDLSIQPIINQSEVYSGMYARVSIRFFAYNQNGKKGIGCGLGNVQKTRDGEPLGGRTSAASDFGDPGAGFGSYNAAPAYQPQPQYAQQPVQPAQYQQAPVYQPQVQPQQAYAPQTPVQQPPMQQPQQPPVYNQPVQQPMQQPVYPQQPAQIDPITGRPLTGGIMGI